MGKMSGRSRPALSAIATALREVGEGGQRLDKELLYGCKHIQSSTII